MATTYHNTGSNISQGPVANSAVYSASAEFLTCPASSTVILKSCQITNTTEPSASTYYDINVCAYLYDNSTTTTHSLAYFSSVPKYASLDVLSDNLVLEENDKLIVDISGSSAKAAGNYSVSVVGSFLKIT